MKADRSVVIVYAAELTLGVVFGFGLLLLVLGALHLSFPQSSGLGALVRADGVAGAGNSELQFEGMQDLPVAMLTSVDRDVRDRPAVSVVWSAADAGAPLGDRHAVQSFADSGATITFDGGSTIVLEEKSVVVVRRPRRYGNAGRRRASVLFMDGLVRARVGGAQNGAVDLELVSSGGTVRPHASGEVAEIALGTHGDSSTLAVHTGKAELVWQDRTTVVSQGYMVQYDENHAPGVPFVLPDPPGTLTPADGASFDYRTVPPRVEFAWKSSDRPEAFRLQIARDAQFTDIAYEGRHDRSPFVHGNLEAGEYHWRVAALYGSLAGSPSPSSRFVVTLDARPPTLLVKFPELSVTEPLLVLHGETEPGCRIVVGTTHVPTDAGGRFEHPITLRAGYNFLVVQAIDRAGNTTFANHTVVAELTASGSQP